MLRDRKPTDTLMTYATFFALSLAIHMVVILGGRPEAAPPPGGEQAKAAQEADGEEPR